MSGEGHRLQLGWNDNCIFLFLDVKKCYRLSSPNIVAIFQPGCERYRSMKEQKIFLNVDYILQVGLAVEGEDA